jgi:hypothetical protein
MWAAISRYRAEGLLAAVGWAYSGARSANPDLVQCRRAVRCYLPTNRGFSVCSSVSCKEESEVKIFGRLCRIGALGCIGPDSVVRLEGEGSLFQWTVSGPGGGPGRNADFPAELIGPSSPRCCL